MQFAKRFFDKFSSLIVTVLSCFDRVIFKGYFRVPRQRIRNGQRTKVWCPMNKGVTNLPSYQRVCRAANDRYLNALSVVNDPTPAYQQVADLTESKTHQGRRYAGFNPARKDDVRRFRPYSPGLMNCVALTTATSSCTCRTIPDGLAASFWIV